MRRTRTQTCKRCGHVAASHTIGRESKCAAYGWCPCEGFVARTPRPKKEETSVTATGDDDGGIAVWPAHDEYGRTVYLDHCVIVGTLEHRLFTVGRAIAMLVFVREVQEAVRGAEGRIDDPHGRLRAAFLGTIMQAEARYREGHG